jgi:geranylgeranyl reductase family protein
VAHPEALAAGDHDLPVIASPLDCEILVVGAGPAGSAIAARLAAAGRDVLLVEARQHPRPKACAEYASPRILEELRRVGIADADWQADAVPLRGMRLIRGADAVDVRYRRGSEPRMAWSVERSAFDASLAAHAAARGARVMERCALQAVLRNGERAVGAIVRAPDGERRVTSRWLIGADGARSRVAAGLGATRPVRAPRRLGLVAHYEGVAELADHGEMHIGPGWYVGLAPLSGDRLNVGMALPLNGDRRRAEERFTAALDALPAVARRLRGRKRLTPIRGVAPIGQRVSSAAGPGWMLVGDAAGFIDPFTGEGIYRALRSARAAAEALVAGDLGAEARYLVARREAFAAKDALSWVIQGMLAAPPLMGYALRRLATREELAIRLGSALGDCRPASDALSPRFVVGLLWP